jgi:hypothetical protein
MAERIFRVFSLAFLSIGFVVAIAGADRNGPQDLANATTDLIQHVSAANDANSINAKVTVQSNKGVSLSSDTSFVAQAKTDSPNQVPQKSKLANPQNLPVQGN